MVSTASAQCCMAEKASSRPRAPSLSPTLTLILAGTLQGYMGRRSLIIMAFALHVAFFAFYFFCHHQVIGYTSSNLSNYVPPHTQLPAHASSVAAYRSGYTSGNSTVNCYQNATASFDCTT